MPRLSANGIEIEYDEFGDPAGPPLLLIMGLATQMIAWTEPFCEMLAAHGFRVIRFDNRDIGLSTKLSGARAPGPVSLRARQLAGLRTRVPYTLKDMATDAVGLLDALELDDAHFVGASMGGMIAQRAAIHFPHRVRSLVSIMSSSGHGRLPGPRPQVLHHMLFRRPKDASTDAVLDYSVGFMRRIGSPGYPQTDDEWRARLRRSLQRSYHPAGFKRHLAAVIHDGDRSDALRELDTPALVIHGTDDLLVPPACGRHTARSIPGARLELIEGMGHDLAPGLYQRLTDLIGGHARSVEGTAGGQRVDVAGKPHPAASQPATADTVAAALHQRGSAVG